MPVPEACCGYQKRVGGEAGSRAVVNEIMLSKMTKLTSDRICSHSWIQGFGFEKTNINWAGSFSAFSRVPASCNSGFKEHAKSVLCSLGSKASSLLSSPLSLSKLIQGPPSRAWPSPFLSIGKDYWLSGKCWGRVSVPGKWEVE